MKSIDEKDLKIPEKVSDGLLVREELCDFCGTCVAVCPVDCIELSETQIRIDLGICNLCLNCVSACPLHIISQPGVQ